MTAPGNFEQRFLALVARSDVSITVANVAYQLEVSIDEARGGLLRLVELGALVAPDEPAGVYEMPNRPVAEERRSPIVSEDHPPLELPSPGAIVAETLAALLDVALVLAAVAAIGAFAWALPGRYKIWAGAWLLYWPLHLFVHNASRIGPLAALIVASALAALMAFTLPATHRIWAAAPAGLAAVTFMEWVLVKRRSRR